MNRGKAYDAATLPLHRGPDPHGAAQRSSLQGHLEGAVQNTSQPAVWEERPASTGASAVWGPSEPPVTQLREHLWAHLPFVSTPQAKTSGRDTPKEGSELALGSEEVQLERLGNRSPGRDSWRQEFPGRQQYLIWSARTPGQRPQLSELLHILEKGLHFFL